jgi:hypothetical protein
MNKILRPVLVAAALCAAAVGDAAAQGITGEYNNIGYGTKAGEFLLLPVGGRGAALGSAFSALADDATALYWNPAGIGFQRKGSVHLSRLQYLADTDYTWGGLSVPLGSSATWLVGFQAGGFSFGDQPVRTVDQPDGTGSTYSNSMFVGGLTVAMNVTDRFSFGITGKYVQESLANTTGSAMTADIGTNYHTNVAGRPFRASFAIMNIAGELRQSGSDLNIEVPVADPSIPNRQDPAEFRTQGYSLPSSFRIGLAWDAVNSARNTLTLAGDFWQPAQNSTSTALGAEFTFRPSDSGLAVALRGGYSYEPDRTYEARGDNGVAFDDDSTDGLSFGGGIGYRPTTGLGLSLDYAYRNMGLLGNTNLFSVSIGW